jgi:hypothetical protein
MHGQPNINTSWKFFRLKIIYKVHIYTHKSVILQFVSQINAQILVCPIQNWHLETLLPYCVVFVHVNCILMTSL